MTTERKSFGVALILWLFLGGLGIHRVYIQEKVSVILWYWILVVCTLGIFVLIDAFRLKGLIEIEHMKRQYKNN